ncbi:hypothetical protein [uncultured Roseobacter sp.]|uniref:hypothetical protein n=1 Tax=uncultured Roseobacter sp. TaxID=114847 RepID=UPI0026311722|nr:hypothetical protein [uncultured Roseobacter sp.]
MLDLSNLLACPVCQVEFIPKRTNQKYCTPKCQKAATKNTARKSREGEHRVRSVYHYERTMRLAEMLYTAHPQERLGTMQHILSFVEHDAGLRNILTDRKLLRAHPSKDKRLYFGGSRKTFPQAANEYTKQFFGVSIVLYIKSAINGTLPDDHEVAVKRRDEVYVPRLTSMKRAKCWHRPLSGDAKVAAEAQSSADYARVSQLVAAVQRRVDAL